MPTETEQAQLLADWLDQPPGTAPPPGLDPDVVAAVYALRPDRAPAPRVTIDDVLARVATGPFAGNPVPSDPQEQAEAGAEGELVSLGAARERAAADRAARTVARDERVTRRAQRAWQRWWVGPAAGLGLAAAAALLLVVPTAGRYLSPTAQKLAEDVPAVAVPAAPPITEPALPGEPDDRARAASRPAAAAGGAPLGDAAPGRVDTGGAADDKGAGEPEPPPAELARDLPAQAIAETSENAGAGLEKVDDGWFSWGEGKKEREASADEDGVLAEEAERRDGAATGGESAPTTSTPSPAPVAAVPPPPAAPAKAVAESAPAATPASARAEVQTSSARPTSSSSTGVSSGAASTKSKSAEPRGGSAGAGAAPAASAPAEALGYADAAADTLAPGADSGRDAAVPRDYDANWFRGRADVVSAFADAASTDAAAALATYARFFADGDARVRQEAFYRSARLEQSRGRADAARTLADRGLSTSTTNTPTRSMLLVLRGDLRAARGDAAGAAADYAEAARLNGLR